MEKSDQLNELAAAMVAAQPEIEAASKDAVNPHFRTRYADLGAVMDACKDALNRNGIAVLQAPAPSEGPTLALETVLMHKSGQWVSGRITMPLSKADPQGYGSALTYARRYGLAAMVGVTAEDDDGEAAQGRGRQQQRQAPRPPAREQRPANGTPPPSQAPLADNQQFLAILDEAFQHGDFSEADRKTVRAKVCQKHKVREVTDLPPDSRQKFIDALVNGELDKFKTAPAAA